MELLTVLTGFHEPLWLPSNINAPLTLDPLLSEGRGDPLVGDASAN
jgi:hypothetical protein